MICLQEISYFDCKYVGIGAVVSGMEVLDIINQVSCNFDVPDLPIKIVHVEKVNSQDDE